MLEKLTIKNYLLLKNIEIDLSNGFNIITGETGAGKSITLDALGLLLGDKADFSQVRTGQKEAHLSALVDISDLPHLQAA